MYRFHQLAQLRDALFGRVTPRLGHQRFVKVVGQRRGAGEALAQLAEDVLFGTHH
ncbi:hypothetical protein D3C71_2097780 [compost metagenome]